MKEHEIAAAVRDSDSVHLADQAAAEAAVRAVLRVLGQRLAGGQPKDLAAQLPPAFAAALPAQGRGERFDVDEFYRRIAAEEGEGVSHERARQHARAVFAVLRVALTGDELGHLAAQLPVDYRTDLLAEGPVHH